MSDIPDREGNTSYKAPRAAYTLGDFKLIRRLGDGSYSQVVQARHNGSEEDYAIKMIDKGLILRNKQTVYVKTERTLLDLFEYPGIVNLYFTFQDQHSLYLGLTLCSNGELYDQIRRKESLKLEEIQFYAAEVVLILQYLRRHKVVHRDLKPENLLLDDTGHLLLCDFGSAKILHPPTKGPNATDHSQAAMSPTHSGSLIPPGSLPPLVPESAATPSAATSTTPTPPVSSAPTAAQPKVGNLLEADMSTPTGNPFDGAHSSTPPSTTANTGLPSQQLPGQSAQPSSAGVASDTRAAGATAQTSSPVGAATLGAQLEQLASNVEAQMQQAGKVSGPDDEGASLPRVTSMVGTADYIAPETLENEEVTCAADLWSFGCLLYQMAAGKPPFKAASEYLTFNKISAAEYQFPKNFPKPVADLVGQLLVLKPSERLGASKIADLMEHPLFEEVEWETLRTSKAPKFLPPEWLDDENDDGDWELSSLMGAAAAAVAAAPAGSPASPAPGSIASPAAISSPQQSLPKPAGGASQPASTASTPLSQTSANASSKPAVQGQPSTQTAAGASAAVKPVSAAKPTTSALSGGSATPPTSLAGAGGKSAGHAAAGVKPGAPQTGHKSAAGKSTGWQGMGQDASASSAQHASQSNWQDGSAGNSLLAAGAVMQMLGQDQHDASVEF